MIVNVFTFGCLPSAESKQVFGLDFCVSFFWLGIWVHLFLYRFVFSKFQKNVLVNAWPVLIDTLPYLVAPQFQFMRAHFRMCTYAHTTDETFFLSLSFCLFLSITDGLEIWMLTFCTSKQLFVSCLKHYLTRNGHCLELVTAAKFWKNYVSFHSGELHF